MSKKKSTILIYSEYYFLRGLAGFAAVLPERLAWGFGKALGRLIHLLDRRHRKVADDNLAHAFPEKSPEERERLIRKVYQHLGLMIAETLRVPKMLKRGVEHYVECPDVSEVREAMAAGKGLILATGHIGNWEIAGHATASLGVPLHSVARPLDNPLLDAYVVGVRQLSGQKIIGKRGAVRDMVRTLAKGKAVAVLFDQDARKHGIFVQFFGRPASTWPSAAALSLKLGTPIVFGFVRRAPDRFRYQMVVDDVLWPEPTGNRTADIANLTQKITTTLEKHIRRCPEQWFWLHRRWKTVPPAQPGDEGGQ